MMPSLPFTASALAQEAADFAGKITPCRERWEYCFDRASYIYPSKRGYDVVCLNTRTLPVCERILGVRKGSAGIKMARLRDYGFEASEAEAATWSWHKGPYFTVGPMEAWHVGHVYFARLVDHPHVVKIGFSRRVRGRLEDVESNCKARITVNPDELRVGTMADEHWWHRHWKPTHISGEWFFDPAMADRRLPSFLQKPSGAEAGSAVRIGTPISEVA
jgi:hypothetical protein